MLTWFPPYSRYPPAMASSSSKLLALALSSSFLRSYILASSSLLPAPSRRLPGSFLSLRFCSAATAPAAAGSSVAAASSGHPWPEWGDFLEKLWAKGYFERAAPASGGDAAEGAAGEGETAAAEVEVGTVASPDPYPFRDLNRVRNACLKFARERFDLLSSLPKHDIQAVVECGCPNIFRKVVSSAKRLREFVQVDEGDACGACKLRGSCDKAYVIPKAEEGARTVDVVRILLSYAIDPTSLSRENSVDGGVQGSARKLLSELTMLSDTMIDPSLPKPVFQTSSKQDSLTKLSDKDTQSVAKSEVSTGKGRETPVTEMKKGDWLCPNCNFLNFARNRCCLECKADGPKKIKAATTEMKMGDWICPHCNFLNFARNRCCLECKADGPNKIEAATTEMKMGDWICPQCHFMNFARNKMCFKCEESRPNRQLNPGEWECPSCEFVNFGRNKVCLKCNHDRPEDDTQDSERGYDVRRNTKRADNSRSFHFVGQEDDEEEVLPYEGEYKHEVSRRVTQAQRRSTGKSRSFDFLGKDDDEDDVLPYEGERKHVASRRATPAQRRFTAARNQ